MLARFLSSLAAVVALAVLTVSVTVVCALLVVVVASPVLMVVALTWFTSFLTVLLLPVDPHWSLYALWAMVWLTTIPIRNKASRLLDGTT